MRRKLPEHPILLPPQAKRVFEGVLYDVYQWPQPLFDGTTATFEMLKRYDTVKVVAIKDGQIVVIRQEQPHIGLFYDIPGGINDHEEEDEQMAAERELREETGLSFKTWKLLSIIQPHTKVEQFVYTFLATDIIGEEPQQLDGGEKITIELMSLPEAKRVLSSNQARYPVADLDRAATLEELLQLPSL